MNRMRHSLATGWLTTSNLKSESASHMTIAPPVKLAQRDKRGQVGLSSWACSDTSTASGLPFRAGKSHPDHELGAGLVNFMNKRGQLVRLPDRSHSIDARVGFCDISSVSISSSLDPPRQCGLNKIWRASVAPLAQVRDASLPDPSAS
jgi:hypothetical protein